MTLVTKLHFDLCFYIQWGVQQLMSMENYKYTL